MTDLATLALKIDSSQVKTGVNELDQLTNAGTRAESAVERLGDEAVATGGKMRTASAAAAEYAAKAQASASAAMSASGGMGQVGTSGKLASHHVQNLSFQLNDMFVGLASGQKPMTVFMQQGTQIAQIMGQAGVGVGGLVKQVGSMALSFLAANPLVLAAGVVAGGAALGIAAINREANNGDPIRKYAESLGLTAKQMRQLDDVTVTFGDTAKAVFQVAGRALWDGVGTGVSAVWDYMGEWLSWIGTNVKSYVNLMIGSFVGGYRAIIATWRQWPAAIGDIFFTGVNMAIEAINSLVAKAIEGMNNFIRGANAALKFVGSETLIPEISAPQIANLKNQYAGAAKEVGESIRAAAESALGTDFLGDAWDATRGAVAAQAQQNARDRIRKQAEEQGFFDPRADSGRAKKLSEEEKAYQAALKAAQAYLDALTEETAKIGKSAIEIKRMEVAAAAAKAPTDALKTAILEAGAAWEKATKSQAVKDFIKNTVEPLEFENSLLGKNVVERAKATAERELEAAGIERGTEAWQRYYDAIVKPAEVEFNNDNLREYLGLLDDVADRTRDAAQAMSDAFGSVGGAIGALAETFANYAADREAAAQRVAEAERTAGENSLEYVRAKNAQDALQIQHYGSIASAAKGLFKEHSIGYKAMATAEKVLAAVQLARALKAIFLRGAETAATVTGAAIETGAVVAAEGVKTATAVAGAAVRTPLKVSEGAASIFASLGPFGFPVVAAMIAVMAALGFGGGGGGSSAPSMPTPEDLQAGAGTGSVLGDPKAQSESIKNSLEIMASNSNSDLEYTNQMLRALKGIETGIRNLAGTIARQIQVDGSLFSTSSLNLGQTGSPGFLGLFSSSTTRTLYDAGITLAAATVGDILAQGISGSTYQVVQQVRRTSGFLGIGGGTRTTYQTTNGALGSDITSAIVDVIESLRQGLIEGADIIGLEGAQAILDSFQVNLGQLSFQGLTGQEIENQLNAIFSRVGDDMAGALYPALAEMQQVGEGLFETFTRVAREYQVVDMALASIGMEFGAVGIGSVAARDALVQLFGTLDEFASQTEFFADKFLTEAERIAPIADAVRAEMARLGLSGISTRDQFKDVVLGLDLTTTAGREMFAALMAVAPAFFKVSDYAERTARETTDALQETIDKFTSFATSLRKYRDTLYAVDSNSANAYAAARAKFLATSALAAGGDAGALGNLESVSRTFLDAARNNASSYAQYQRDVAAVAGAVDRGIFAAEETADYAQLQIDALNASLGILTSIDEGIGAVAAILSGQPVNVSAPVPLPPSAPVQQPIGDGTPRSPDLINELQAMRNESKAQALALAGSMATIARLAERWDADGLFVRGADPDAPIEVEVAA